MATTPDEHCPGVLTVHKWCCSTNRVCVWFFFRGICVLQLSKCSSVKSRLIDFRGAIFFAKDTVCTRGEFLFFPSSLPLDPSPLNPVSTPRGRTLRTASMESNPLKNAKAPWPRRHQMNPYRGGRGEGGKKKTILPFKRHKSMTDSLPSASSAAGAKRFKETSVWMTAMWELRVCSYGLSSQQIVAWKKQR